MITGAICICHKQFSYPQMWTSLAGLIKPPGTAILTAEGTLIAGQRNDLVERALDRGAAWVLFIDDDHLIPPDGLARLLSWDGPAVVGGLYTTRLPPYKVTAHRNFRPLSPEEADTDGLVSIDAIGMGFTLIHRRAFEAVERPWFRLGQHTDGQELGEDVYFTRAVRAAGLDVAVDCTLRVPHLALKAVVYEGHGQIAIRELGHASRALALAPVGAGKG